MTASGLGAQKTYESSLLNYAVAQANIDHHLPVPVLRRGIPDRHYSHARTGAQTLATHRRAAGISTRVVTLGTGEGDIGTTKE